MPLVTIDNDTFNEILVEVGFPIISFSEFPYTEEQVKTIFLWKALREYYKWFPLKETQEIQVGEYFEVDFPDAQTFGVLDCKLNTNTIKAGTLTGDPFIDATQIMGNQAMFRSSYGTGNHYNRHISMHTKRAEYEAIKNSFSSFRFDVDRQLRKVTGYSNIQNSRVTIVWAKHSTDYGTVEFDKIEEVNKLSASEILMGMANLYGMQSTNLENEIDADRLKDRAEQLREEVLESWRAKTKPVMYRG